jgi:hypothetical protein
MPYDNSLWKNPHQRYGFIKVNVLVGAGVEDHDGQLFFGPVESFDVFHVEDNERIDLSQLLAKLGIFASTKDAQRNGWRKPIPDGYSEFTRIGKKHAVFILKILKPVNEEC